MRCAREAGGRRRDRHRLRLARGRRPGRCSSRSRASTPTARRSPGRRSSAAPRRSSPSSRRRPASTCRGRSSRTRASRSPCWPRRSTAIRAARCRSSASPAPTARRRPRISSPSIFEAAGIRCGMLGTVGYRIGDEVREATRTTPEAPDVQALLREMVDRGCGACAMEVSSHALSLRRVDGITLRRRRLHEPDARPSRFPRRHGRLLPRQAPAVRDAAARRAEPDQPRRSARRRRSLEAGGRPVTYAINRAADVTPGPLSFSLDGLSFDVRTPRGTLHVPLEARRPAERLQHPRGRLDGDRARPAVRRDRARPAVARRRARTVPGRLRRQGRSHRRRRLRAHRRRAAQPARDGAAAGARAG